MNQTTQASNAATTPPPAPSRDRIAVIADRAAELFDTVTRISFEPCPDSLVAEARALEYVFANFRETIRSRGRKSIPVLAKTMPASLWTRQAVALLVETLFFGELSRMFGSNPLLCIVIGVLADNGQLGLTLYQTLDGAERAIELDLPSELRQRRSGAVNPQP